MESATPLHARFDTFLIEEANARVLKGDVPIDLPPRAFAVLCALARHQGQLVGKDALLDAVWGHQHVSESVLKTTISQLRAALADDPKSPRYIETAPRRGYRFIAAVTPAAAGAPAARQLPRDALIGREASLAVLEAELAQATAGACRIVFVAGEPGIGKSALIERFAAAAAAPHALGQCVEQYGSGEPYLPVLEALNALCRLEGPGLIDLMRHAAPTWLVQLPWYLTDADRQQLQREVAGATQQRMLREIGELLDRCTSTRPLLLVLEDLHWADEATVQLIAYLARRRGPARVMLLGSLRTTEVIAGEHPLRSIRQELRLHQLCRELDLDAFSEHDVSDYLASRMGGQAAEESFVRQVHRHTDGLPLFVVNLVDALIADGVLSREGETWQVRPLPTLEVPRNIVGVIEKQIARLPEQLRQWLGVAAVAGVEFADLSVADAIDLDVQPLREAFDDLVRQQHWLRSAGWAPLADGRTASRFVFRHALYRRVFYQSLGDARRTHWHLRLAQALEAMHGGSPEVAGELAMHFERGRGLARAVHYLTLAATRALRRFAPSEALQSARHGLRLLAPLPEGEGKLNAELELRVIEGVSLAQQTIFSSEEVGSVFARAQQLGDQLPENPARARALHGLWWVNFGRGEMDRARSLASRILAVGEASGEPSLLVAGNSALGMTLTHIGEIAQARHHLQAAVAAYEAAGDSLSPELFMQDPSVEARCYLAVLSWWTGQGEDARDYLALAEAVAARSRHPPTQALTLHIAAVVHAMAREYALVIEKTRRIYELVENHWLAGGPSAHGWIHGRAMVALGQVEEGLQAMREAAQRCEASGLRVGLAGFHQMYADACRSLGRYQEALASLDAGLAIARAGGELCLLSPLHRGRGEVLLELGEREAAERELRVAVAEAARRGALQHEREAQLLLERLAAASG